MDRDFETPADGYLLHRVSGRDDGFRAWQQGDQIVPSGDLDRAGKITLLLLKTAPDETVEHVGAGPVEDFGDVYGHQGVDRGEQDCDLDSRLQYAWSGIWLLLDRLAYNTDKGS